MVKTWLYVLRNTTEHIEYGTQYYYYVGMTFRLLRRLKEHYYDRGAKCTERFNYDEVVALYEIGDGKHHDHELENRLVRELMSLKGNLWWQVRGGDRCSFINEKPTDLISKVDVCECCGFPLFGARCPKTRLTWLASTFIGTMYDIQYDCATDSFEPKYEYDSSGFITGSAVIEK